jgi:hypothetical protein
MFEFVTHLIIIFSKPAKRAYRKIHYTVLTNPSPNPNPCNNQVAQVGGGGGGGIYSYPKQLGLMLREATLPRL